MVHLALVTIKALVHQAMIQEVLVIVVQIHLVAHQVQIILLPKDLDKETEKIKKKRKKIKNKKNKR